MDKFALRSSLQILSNSARGDSCEAANQNIARSRFEKPAQIKPAINIEYTDNNTKCCEDNCVLVIKGLDGKSVEEINNLLVGSKYEKRNQLLKHLQTQNNLGCNTDRFCWKGNYFCNRTFAEAVKTSTFILDDVLKRYKLGVTKFLHGNKGIAKFSIPRSKFIVWMRCFLRRFAQSAPDSNV